MDTEISARIAAVKNDLAHASARSNSAADDVTLIAVSKTHPSELLRAAMVSGITEFGENRVQEAEGKIKELGRRSARWHLIGHLQANKARRVVQLFDLVHTLDSPDLAARLDRLCEEEGRAQFDVLLQIDLGGEETKSGAREEELPLLVDALHNCARLRLCGLMTIPPFYEDTELVRPFFRRLRELRDELARAGAFGALTGELSMGMSHDFAVAIEEGATMIRVGTAIFGTRANMR